jgi:elongation factor G
VKAYDPANIRNLAIVGHQGCGKTTLAEAILFQTGAIARMGSVDDGTSNLDYHANEIHRRTSIYTALGACEHEGTKFNLLDTPGFDDFRGEVVAALSVVESGLLVVRSDAGVEVGAEALWELLAKSQLPTMIVVSKMDKEHADFDRALAQIRARLSPKAIPVQLPIGRGESFRGVIDVTQGTAWIWDKPGQPHKAEIPADMRSAYEQAREELFNAAAEHDDALVEKFLEEGTLSYEELVKGIGIGVRDRTFFPVCAVSATSGIGRRPLLHCVKEYLPAPDSTSKLAGVDDKGAQIQIPIGAGAPTLARVFKIANEKDAGDLALMRVYAGAVATGGDLLNLSRNSSERISGLFSLEGKNRERIERIGVGDFGAAVKLKGTHAGETLGEKGGPGKLPPLAFPTPNSRVAIRPLHQGDEDKVAQGFTRIHEEDPTFKFGLDPQTHELVLEGQGELHFDVLVDKLKEVAHVEVTRHEPKIPYLETLKTSVDIPARHKKQTGGRGQFADVTIKFEPLPRGAGFEFVDGIVGGVVPGKFIPAVEKGLRESMSRGPLAGAQVVDVRATLHDGGFHAVDSSEAAFKMAASLALKKAFEEAKSVLLEPIYTVEVKVPDEAMGDVMGDLSSRRGRIVGTDSKGQFAVVKAQIPLSELYKYSTHLRSMTQGRASHSVTFDHYQEVPGELAAKIIEQAKKEAEEA